MMQRNSIATPEFRAAATGKKILVVDDDPALRQSLAEQLQLHEEFQTAEAESGANALERVRSDYFDAILLDVGLPDMDGREVCRLMRRSGLKTPIIMLTGADTDADTILGLDAGPIAKTASSLWSCWRSWARSRASNTPSRNGFVT